MRYKIKIPDLVPKELAKYVEDAEALLTHIEPQHINEYTLTDCNSRNNGIVSFDFYPDKSYLVPEAWLISCCEAEDFENLPADTPIWVGKNGRYYPRHLAYVDDGYVYFYCLGRTSHTGGSSLESIEPSCVFLENPNEQD